jgi:hypothetical protein
MEQTVSLHLIVVLAIMQGILGILRALEWFRLGIDLSGRDVFILPMVGAVVFARGGLVGVMALLYILFALGALLGQRWAWWLGLVVSLVTGLGVLGLVLEGAPIAWSLLWLIVPVVLVWYLLSIEGHQGFRH